MDDLLKAKGTSAVSSLAICRLRPLDAVLSSGLYVYNAVWCLKHDTSLVIMIEFVPAPATGPLIMEYSALHCTVLHCTALNLTALHCTALH